MQIGILALQGDFSLHQKMLQTMGISCSLVKDINSLNNSDGLIIPGGESTTFMNLVQNMNLFDALIEFGQQKVIFGTCAGSIILAGSALNENRFHTLNLIDVTVQRNAFGRQVDSFIDDIQLSPDFFSDASPFEGVFIRAPKFISAGRSIKILATYRDEPVLVESPTILLSTFHPELTDDLRIHRYLVDKIKSRN